MSTSLDPGAGDTPHPRSTRDDKWIEVQQGNDFQELRRRVRGFAFPMTALFLAWYLLYVLASGYARGFMSTKLWGHINVAYVFGLLQFISTFVIASIYSRHANRKFDPLAEQLRRDLERH